MDENNDAENILNSQEEEVLETSNENDSEQDEGESVEEYKARLAKAEELANNYKIRAEKAERLAKGVKPEATKQSQKADVSTQDLYALIDAKVPQEDIEDVKEYATLKGISISEALKSNVVKTILSDKAEMRNVASASNVGNSKRSSGRVSDDILLAKASKGELPDSDEDLMRIIKARKGIK